MAGVPGYFTGEGDDGSTGLLGPGRTRKHDPRIEAVGELDEAAAALGLARALSNDGDVRGVLESLQRHLYEVMAEVAAPGENAARFRSIGSDEGDWLEEEVGRLS